MEADHYRGNGIASVDVVLWGSGICHLCLCVVLTGNGIGVEGAKALASALVTNTVLSNLNLRSMLQCPPLPADMADVHWIPWAAVCTAYQSHCYVKDTTGCLL